MPRDAVITYSIKELANDFMVTARTLRHYEEQGLLSPGRQGQNRIYTVKDRARLSWILRGKRVGFSLTEIGDMLDLYNLGDGRETQVAVTKKLCRDRVDALQRQMKDIRDTIEELEGFCEEVDSLVKKKNGEWIIEG
ncbi:MAG: MerR family DNA-binding transcriptional regulator [Kordiimonadaceae bacterium]|nr:MerR family DNA-binding transcriptional regulator [Kordiimonadaceae bacterium]